MKSGNPEENESKHASKITKFHEILKKSKNSEINLESPKKNSKRILTYFHSSLRPLAIQTRFESILPNFLNPRWIVKLGTCENNLLKLIFTKFNEIESRLRYL